MREHRDKAQGLPDLLNYAMMVDEGIMLLKDGAFMASWDYHGPDLNSASAHDIEYLTAIVNNALCQLGDGWMLHADLIRTDSQGYPPIEASCFPDPTSRLIDEDRRQQYLAEDAHFESHYALTVTYLPPTDVASRFKGIFIEGEKAKTAGWEKVLQFFKARIDQLQNSLSKFLVLNRLSSAALLALCHSDLTGLMHALRLPKIPVYLDALIGSKDLTGGLYPKVGDHFIRVIGLTGFPLETEPGMLSVLESLPITFRWSNRFICLEAHTASRILKVYRRNWMQKRHGLMGMIKEIMSQQERAGFQNRDALAMTEDADQAVEAADSGLVRFGYYTSVLVLMGKDPEMVDASAKLVLKAFEMRGFNGRVETVNAMEAFLGSLPGHGYQNVRKPLIHSLNFADLLPLTSVWAGLSHNPCGYYPPNSPPLFYAATSGSTPFRFNCHVSDVGHTLVIGPTGAGKSTLINLLAAQHLRYPDAQVFWFDKGYSAYTLCKAVGGMHYDIAGESNQISFQPLAHIDQREELDFACIWMESLLECQHLIISAEIRNEIRRALIGLSIQDKPMRTLSHFQGTIQHKAIKEALEFYTLSGVMGRLLDADKDALDEGHFQVFEMGHLMEKGEACTRPTMLYLFHKLRQRMKHGHPTLLFIEEGHAFLEGQFGEEIDTWLREKRKENVAVVFLTQNLKEIMESPHRNILLSSTLTQIFLPDSKADNEVNKSLYSGLGLTDRQIELIKQGVPKRDYYYTSALGQRMINLGLGQVALSFLGVEMKQTKDRQALDDLIAEYGPRWPYEWLKRRGLEDWGDYWLQLSHAQQGALKHAA